MTAKLIWLSTATVDYRLEIYLVHTVLMLMALQKFVKNAPGLVGSSIDMADGTQIAAQNGQI